MSWLRTDWSEKMRMRHIMRPGVMLSNIWPNSRETEGATLRGLEEALALDFFEAIQIVDIPFGSERRRFAQVLKENRLRGSMAVTRIMNLNRLNLSSLDRGLREKSVQVLIGELDAVREAGIERCTLISGPRPESEEERKMSLRLFCDSVDTICRAAAEPPVLEIQIEPLDYFAHKRMALGSAQEGIEIVRELSKRHANLSLCLDTAHMLLNQENIVEAMREGREFLTDFHFCNPCIEKGHDRYGDNHLLFGPPGALSAAEVVEWMVEGSQVGLFTEDRRPTVSFEILSSETLEGSDLLRHCRDFFEACWEKAEPRLED